MSGRVLKISFAELELHPAVSKKYPTFLVVFTRKDEPYGTGTKGIFTKSHYQALFGNNKANKGKEIWLGTHYQPWPGSMILINK